jgi:erythromycin esterase-like protein
MPPLLSTGRMTACALLLRITIWPALRSAGVVLCALMLSAPSASAQAATVLDRVVHDMCNSRVALLGESRTHGVGNAMKFKAELARRLIGECHYNALLFESGIYDFVNIRNAASAGRPITTDAVTAAIGGLWANGDVAPLIPFLAAKVREGTLVLGGVDDQLARMTYAQREMPADLVRYLPRADRERCQTILERHTLWQYTTDRPYGVADKARILDCLDEIARDLSHEQDVNVRDDDSVMVASFHRVVAWDFDEGSLQPVDAGVRSFNDRDRSMYDNFRWWMSRFPPESKVIVWTATVHAARTSVPGKERIIPLGSYLARDFGTQEFVLGISALSGTYGMVHHSAQPLPAAPDSSLEVRALTARGADIRYLGGAELRAAGSAPSRVLGVDFITTRWADVIDGLVVFRDERPPKS